MVMIKSIYRKQQSLTGEKFRGFHRFRQTVKVFPTNFISDILSVNI